MEIHFSRTFGNQWKFYKRLLIKDLSKVIPFGTINFTATGSEMNSGAVVILN
jgi:alcohol dehydrogenase YqhD (iron-dependent ADH family)